MLGASLAINKEVFPLTLMNDVLESEYKIGTMAGTAMESYFTKANKSSMLYAIGQRKLVLAKVGPSTETSNNRAVANMVLRHIAHDNDNLLIFAADILPYLHPELNCYLSRIPTDYMKGGTGFIFPKKWPFTKLMNYYILNFIEDGTITQIKQRWLPKPLSCERDDVKPSNLLDIAILCIIIGVGLALASVIFLLELWNNNVNS